MEIQAAIQETIDSFPFEGYMVKNGAQKGAYQNVSRAIRRHLPEDSKILDFGSGPCDITAIVRRLGYDCYAVDDLGDHWHRDAENRGKILQFIEKSGVKFSQPADGGLPFADTTFDMVMTHDVIEHLHESPREILQQLISRLRPEGLLFVTVPNAGNIRKRLELLRGGTNYPDFEYFFYNEGLWRGHVREYVRRDLELLAKYLELELVELYACDNMLQKVPVRMRGVYKAITGIFPGFKDSWSLIARKPRDWRYS